MALPYFYTSQLLQNEITLDEETSKHITGVLRMKVGEALILTDGKGTKATGLITDDHRKHCSIRIEATTIEPPQPSKSTVAISLLKNNTRWEWFLEKATELGITEIIPLLCTRTEKEKFRHDRMLQIMISAMLQSQQCWLPVLNQPTDFEQVIQSTTGQKFIAHCEETGKQNLRDQLVKKSSDKTILIGPEGDFTLAEIEAALRAGFVPVSLGNTRLRTETAGMAAATLLQLL